MLFLKVFLPYLTLKKLFAPSLPSKKIFALPSPSKKFFQLSLSIAYPAGRSNPVFVISKSSRDFGFLFFTFPENFPIAPGSSATPAFAMFFNA